MSVRTVDQRILNVVLLLMLMLLAGCAPYVDRYRYIALRPASGLALEQEGAAQRKEIALAGSLPLRYRLTRDDYTIDISQPENSVLPGLHLRFAGAGVSATGLRMLARPNLDVASNRGVICASYYPSLDGESLDFGWSADCTDEELPKLIEFEIVDARSRTLGTESLVFDLRSSGWYVLPDAL